MKQSVESTFPVLQIIGDKMQEVAPQHTIYHTVIVRKRQVHFMTDGNCISFRCLYDSRFLLNVSHSQDSYLRLINYRCTSHALERSEIGNGKCTAINIFRH